MTMPQDQIVAGLQAVFAELGIAGERVTAAARLKEDLEIDSLAMAEMTLSLEDQFGIELPDEELPSDLETVGDLVTLIQGRQQAAA